MMKLKFIFQLITAEMSEEIWAMEWTWTIPEMKIYLINFWRKS